MVLNMWVSMIKAGTVSKKKDVKMNEWTLSQQKDIAPSATGGHPNYIIRFPPYWYKNQPAIIGQSSSTVSRWADPLQAVKWTNMLNQKKQLEWSWKYL